MKDLVHSEGTRMVSTQSLNHEDATDLKRYPSGTTANEAYSIR